MGNWDNKEENMIKAKEWNEFVSKNNSVQINNSIINSKIYEPNNTNTDVIVVQDTTHAAIFKTKMEGKLGALNFASYKKPGGAYMSGALAQEEDLCHNSTLYEVISSEELNDYYEYNNKHLNKALYESRILYSPNIVFYNKNRTATKRCDIITCAAPNRKAAQKYQNVPDTIIEKCMKERILNIIKVANDNKVEILILGAFGCGVFGNDSNTTAHIFKECIDTISYIKNNFKLIIFAIPDDKTFNIFNKILG